MALALLGQVAFDLKTRPAVDRQNKLFSRNGQSFLFKAMRLEGIALPLDFNAKLALLKRLETLRAAHTTGLVLSSSQADAMVDLAACAGLPALVEIDLPQDVFTSAATAAALTSAARLLRLLQGRPGLFGYVVNCQFSSQTFRTQGLRRVRRSLTAFLETIHRGDSGALAAVRRRADTMALSIPGEDFIYAGATALKPAELRDYLAALRDIAGQRPVVLEFTEPSPEQDQAVAAAFANGAAGVVAPRLPAPTCVEWLGVRALRPEGAMPFRRFGTNFPSVSFWSSKP